MSILSDLQLILTLVCRDSSRLVSDSLDRKLRWSERAAVIAHVAICRSCRTFKRQMLFIRETSSRIEDCWQLGHSLHQVHLSEFAKARIKTALDHAQNQ